MNSFNFWAYFSVIMFHILGTIFCLYKDVLEHPIAAGYMQIIVFGALLACLVMWK